MSRLSNYSEIEKLASFTLKSKEEAVQGNHRHVRRKPEGYLSPFNFHLL